MESKSYNNTHLSIPLGMRIPMLLSITKVLFIFCVMYVTDKVLSVHSGTVPESFVQ